MSGHGTRLCSSRPRVRSVLLLCWRDTGHPQGGGSEAYLERIGAHLAESGVRVTLRSARYAGSPRREVVDGVHVSRAGGRYSVYIWAGLAMVAARIGLGPLRRARPDVVIDTQNGLPFMARLAFGRRVAVLGDMLELGEISEAAHRDMGRAVTASGAAEFVGLGRWAKVAVEAARQAGLAESHHVTTFEDAVALLLKRLAPDDAVLVKGSRGMRMERVVDALAARFGGVDG